MDYGAKRIGLAVGDSEGAIASPLAVIERGGDMADQARAVIASAAEYGIDAFVVGLPLNMDDSEGPQARIARAFGAALQRLTGKPVSYFDERLSTHGADEHFVGSDLTRKKRKARRDAVAAQIVLQAFLDAGGPQVQTGHGSAIPDEQSMSDER